MMARKSWTAAVAALVLLVGAAVVADAEEGSPARASIAWTRSKDPLVRRCSSCRGSGSSGGHPRRCAFVCMASLKLEALRRHNS